MLNVVNGTLSLSDLSEAMRLGKLGEQVVLKSKKAFEALTFIEGVKAPHDEYFAKYKKDRLGAGILPVAVSSKLCLYTAQRIRC